MAEETLPILQIPTLLSNCQEENKFTLTLPNILTLSFNKINKFMCNRKKFIYIKILNPEFKKYKNKIK